MKLFKALFKLITNLSKEDKKVVVTENYSEVKEPKVEIENQEPEQEEQKGHGIGFCGLLAIVFITLRLTNYIDWSWGLVS